jgi:N-dimethylarginine dimethylaminohydrolase
MDSTTHHSEAGQLLTVFIKPVEQAFISEEKIQQEWKDLNYLGAPDLPKAREEYAYFKQLLEKSGAEVLTIPSDDETTMDSMYCRDAAILTEEGAILCNMGKAEREPEPEALKKAFEKENIPILGTITSPGTLEGGDVAWVDERTLAVGHSYRTNEEGIEQLRALLEPLEVEVVVVPLPHYKGPSDVFHLMSIFSPVDYDLAVVYSPLMPIVFRQFLYRRGYQLVEVPESEFESMGCNVLATGPRSCIMVEGNPETEKLLRQRGCRVMTYPGEEISFKGGGGPTCLTRPVLRKRLF